jgi:hypothetical protein
MARVLFSSIINDISGSVGNCTFQRNSYGNTLRNKPLPSRFATPAQQGVRSNMALITQSWRNLTPQVQQQYNQYVNFSKDTAWNNSNSVLSGYNLFCKWRFYLLQAGLSLPENVIYANLERYTLDPYLRLTSGNLNLSPYPSGSATNCRVACYASAAYAFKSSGSYRPRKYLKTIDLTNSTENLDAEYIATYGILPVTFSQIDMSFIVFAIDTPIIFAEQLFHLQVNP